MKARYAYSFLISMTLVIAGPVCAAKRHSNVDMISMTMTREKTMLFHLECMSGSINCSSKSYVAHWSSIIGEQELNEIRSRWTNALNPYRVSMPIASAPTGRPEFPDLGPSPMALFDFRWAIQQILLSDLSQESRSTALGALIGHTTVVEINSVRDLFAPYFDEWWHENVPLFEQQSRELSKMLTDDFSEPLAKIIEFFGLDDRGIQSVVLVPTPQTDGSAKGFQRGSISVIELASSDNIAYRAFVVVHELVHQLYAESSVAQQANHAALAASRYPGNGAAYGLTNEVLATAIGNGLFAKRIFSKRVYREYLQRELSFYNDPHIDIPAKASVDIVAQALMQEKIISAEFYTRLHRRIADSLNERLFEPGAALKVSTALLADENSESEVVDLSLSLGSSSFYTHTWDKQRESSFLVAKYDSTTTMIVGSPSQIFKIIDESVLLEELEIDTSTQLPCFHIKPNGGLVFLVSSSDIGALEGERVPPKSCIQSN